MLNFTNGSLKTLLGWVIVTTQLGLFGLIFVLSLFGKLTSIERDSAFAAIGPQFAIYLSAVVMFMLKHSESQKAKSSSEHVSIHTVVITLLLPLLVSLAGLCVVIMSALGQIEAQSFTRYISYLQTAYAFISTTIYGHFFRKELSLHKEAPVG